MPGYLDFSFDPFANFGRPFFTVGVRLELCQLFREAHVDIAAKLNVSAAARHVGSDGDLSRLPGLGDYLCFLLMVPGVEHVVRDFAVPQQFREVFGFVDRHGADQRRLIAGAAFFDEVDDCFEFFDRGAIDFVMLIVPDTGHVGVHLNDVQLIDVAEFRRFGHRRTGHAGELFVEPEIVLEGNRGKGLVFVLDLDPFLGFERLVQPFGVAPSFHHPPGKLVDNKDLIVLDDVIGVDLEQGMRLERLVDVVDHCNVGDIVQRRAFFEQPVFAQQRFNFLGPRFVQGDGLVLFVLFVILGADFRDHGVDTPVHFRGIIGRAGDDQRGPRFVDQDAVDFIDNGVIDALDHLVEPEIHVIAQIIEAELVIGAIGHVGRISRVTFRLVQPMNDAPDREPEEFIDLAHPGGVALRQVIIDRYDVHALARQGIEIDRQRGHQRLAFTGLHLGDGATAEDHAAHQLDVEMTLTQGAFGRFTDRREGVVQQIVEGFARFKASAQPIGSCANLIIA